MDDMRTRDYARAWATVAMEMHPSFTHILEQAQAIRHWLAQSSQLSTTEREALLEHLTALEATADRLVTLTGSPAPPTSET